MLDPLPSPENDAEIVRRIHHAQLLWKACLVFPFFYVALAWLLDRYVFTGYGFWPKHPEAYHKWLVGFTALAIAAQGALRLIHRHYTQKMRDYRLRPRYMAEALWKRTLYGAVCGDFLSFLGLVLFMFNAKWNVLMYFCLGSYILYGQIAPHPVKAPGSSK
jgi:hypothetical protein